MSRNELRRRPGNAGLSAGGTRSELVQRYDQFVRDTLAEDGVSSASEEDAEDEEKHCVKKEVAVNQREDDNLLALGASGEAVESFSSASFFPPFPAFFFFHDADALQAFLEARAPARVNLLHVRKRKKAMPRIPAASYKSVDSRTL